MKVKFRVNYFFLTAIEIITNATYQ